MPLAWGLIAVLITIVGFFLTKLFSDHKELQREHNELRADFRVLSQRQESDMHKQRSDTERIEELLTEKLHNITDKISEIQATVNTFVTMFLNK